ncbi:MAG: hypothetical protein R2832_16065 [Rhodothermales bacterium]
MPADSLSRSFSQTIGEDTLLIASESLHAADLAYPRTLLLDSTGALLVSDGKNGGIWRSADPLSGSLEPLIADASLSAPYLAGLVRDTLVIFSAGSNEIVLAHEGNVVRRFSLDDADAGAALRYAGVRNARIAIKSLDEDEGSHLSWYATSGTHLERDDLRGAYWRHAGLLKSDGDSLLSLRGYLPQLDVIDGTSVDSVGLYGFDSPMLARTRSFEYGGVESPPLIVPSASACGNNWFVLNTRPGWIRIDRYDRTGRLLRAYIQPNPSFDRELLPTDIAVDCSAAGGPLVAVAIASPDPEIRLYTLPR